MTVHKSIAPSEYWRVHKADPAAILVDLSSPKQFNDVHALGAVRVCLQDAHVLAEQTHAVHRNLYVISRYGAVADSYGETLSEDGFDNVVSIQGGTKAWIASGLPTASTHEVRDCIIGVSEMSILIAALLGTFLYPHLIMLVIMAAAGLVAACLAVFDDHLCAAASRSLLSRQTKRG